MDQNFDWRMLTQSALDWWEGAGVDVSVGETPRDWLALPPPTVPPVVHASPIQAAARTAEMPTTLDAFLTWRMGPEAPDAGWPGRRLGPEGNVDASLWIVTDLPDRDDLTEGRLMSGAQGRLFDRMLAAIGRTRADVMLLPLATARPPSGRIGREVETRLGEIARHHLALANAPSALLMGETASRAVLGIDCRDARGTAHIVNHTVAPAGVQPSATMIVASLHPRYLLDRPMAKADAWRDLRLVKDAAR